MAPEPGSSHHTQAAILADRAVLDLRQWLTGQSHQRLLLLCDPAAGDAAAEVVAASGLRPVPLLLRHDDVPADGRPYLVEIDSEERHEQLVSATIGQAVSEAVLPAHRGQRVRSVCAWLHTARPVDEMARVMGACGAVMLHGRQRLFRFWDPRVLAYRARAGQPHPAGERAAETTWLFIDWLGQLCRWAEGDDAPFSPSAAAALAPVGALNAVLQRVLHRGVPDMQVPWARAETALRWTRDHGIVRLDDQVRLAADMVLHGDAIVLAEAMQQILAAMRAGKGSYAGATAEFDDEDWRRLAAEGSRGRQGTLQGQTR